jgi:L-ascorbate metabolism protein UlaG (beta-lactamase superfamily)
VLVDTTCTVTWLGHSTVVVDLSGVRLITDPLLRRRIFHLRRSVEAPPGISGVDAVLISHVHWDHLDLRSLERFGRELPVVVPRGASNLLTRRGFRDVTELVAGEVATIGGVNVHATHAEHDMGGRLRRANAPALGYVISGSAQIYFAGDTDLFEGMSQIGPDLELALLPVSGWGPTLPAGHLDPRGAAEALRLLRPRHAIPIHWGTYAPLFGRGPKSNPAAEFRRHAKELAPDVDVQILSPGETITF